MDKNKALNEINKTQSIYSKYALKTKIMPILFNATNINIFIYIFWTLIYYVVYYGYTLNKINNSINDINKKIKENETLGININKNKTLVQSYQSFMSRFIPFFIFIIVVIGLQYVINVHIMRDICGSDQNINFRVLNIYTIIIWMAVLILSFLFLYKIPKMKGVYSNSLIHKAFEKFVQPTKEKIYGSLFKTVGEIENPELKDLVKQINCNFMKNELKAEMGNELKEYCKNDNNIYFLNNINVSNYSEYFKLMEPIINKNGKENEFLKYIIKKDILSEMLWIIKIGLLTIFFIYTKLKNTKCLNDKDNFKENVKDYIDSKMKKCKYEENKAK